VSSVDVRIEVVVQDPVRLNIWLGVLRLQGLIPKTHPTQAAAVADAVAASIPPNSGVEVAFTKGTPTC
jgi:hypothetical protein